MKDDPWAIGNEVLYDLCRRYPYHERDDEIIAKVWLIGRAYSASIERGRGDAAGVGLSNDQFYCSALPMALRKSNLDLMLADLKDVREITDANAARVLKVHAHLVKVFFSLTRKDKRSLASKYLHFHRPDLFFIYDSRAAAGIRKLDLGPNTLHAPKADGPYLQFVAAALRLRREVEKKFGKLLTPRQLDRLLLAIPSRT
jgi:hypothetical protein